MAWRCRRPMRWAGVRLAKGDLLPSPEPVGRQRQTLVDGGYIEEAGEHHLGMRTAPALHDDRELATAARKD